MITSSMALGRPNPNPKALAAANRAPLLLGRGKHHWLHRDYFGVELQLLLVTLLPLAISIPPSRCPSGE